MQSFSDNSKRNHRNGVQKVCVQANFNKCEIAGHIPGYPTTVSRLRRVEICLAPELS